MRHNGNLSTKVRGLQAIAMVAIFFPRRWAMAA
jgi:hypothetical protein